MIDIHTHILPGVDDGAKDFETSISILKLLEQNGVKTVCLTPHMNKKDEEDNYLKLQSRYNELLSLTQTTLDMTILLGAEVMFSPGMKQLLDNNKWCFIGESSRYYLLEFLNNQIPSCAEKVIFDTIIDGYVPVLAHVERYDWDSRVTAFMAYMQKNGVLFQINSGSLLGKYGRKMKKKAVKLIKAGWCNVLASDIHKKDDAVRYNLKIVAEFVTKTFDSKKTQELLFEIPEKIIQAG